MIELKHDRTYETPNSTAGVLFCDSTFLGVIIEDGYRKEKEHGKTRIPPGRYKVTKVISPRFSEKYKGKYGHKWLLGLQDVPGFNHILMHIGNYAKETEGCLLVNQTLAFNRDMKEWEGRSSETAYLWFYDFIFGKKDDEIYITISEEHLSSYCMKE